MRTPIQKETVDKAIALLRDKMDFRLQQKGNGAFVSTHEILGILQEEVSELMDAVRNNSPDEVVEELLDVAVSAIFGIACIKAGATHW